MAWPWCSGLTHTWEGHSPGRGSAGARFLEAEPGTWIPAHLGLEGQRGRKLNQDMGSAGEQPSKPSASAAPRVPPGAGGGRPSVRWHQSVVVSYANG